MAIGRAKVLAHSQAGTLQPETTSGEPIDTAGPARRNRAQRVRTKGSPKASRDAGRSPRSSCKRQPKGQNERTSGLFTPAAATRWDRMDSLRFDFWMTTW